MPDFLPRNRNIREVTGEDSGNGHVEYVGAEGKQTAVLKDQSLMARIAVITTDATAGPRVKLSSAAPTRWLLVPFPTGKLII